MILMISMMIARISVIALIPVTKVLVPEVPGHCALRCFALWGELNFNNAGK